MYEFKELTRLTAIATAALCAYAAFDILGASMALIQGPAPGKGLRAAEGLQLTASC